MSIIGKQYKAFDNSYSINLSSPLIRDKSIKLNYINSPYLAGTCIDLPISSTILTEPFKMSVKSDLNPHNYYDYEFIVVSIDWTKDSALIMFHPDGVVMDKLDILADGYTNFESVL